MLTLRELRTPLGYNQNAMLASDTNLLKTGQLSEGQRLQQNDAIVQNNTTEANYENAKNGMTGGVLPVMNVGGDGPLVIGQANPDLGKIADEALEERLNREPEQVEPIIPQSASIPISANKDAYQDAESSDASAEEKPLDIRALTDRLAAQQEAERAKFERRRMADRISRMGFALGNLVGAGGGKTDASAITLDDGTKTVGEYRKDMEDINKENQAAYQRALELIYRKEDQDYKERVHEANVENAKAKLAADIEDKKARRDETAQNHRTLEDIRRTQVENTAKNNEAKTGIMKQNANTSAKNADTAAKNANTKASAEARQAGGSTAVITKTDAKGRTETTTRTVTPNGSSQTGSTGTAQTPAQKWAHREQNNQQSKK